MAVIAKVFVATVFATAIRERIAVTATIANARTMRSANGVNAKPIVEIEDARVMRTAGNVAQIAIAQAAQNAIIRGNATLTVATEDAMATRTARHVTIAAVRKTKIVPLAHQRLIRRAAWTGAATGSGTGTKIARIVLKMLVAQKGHTAIMATVSSVSRTVTVNQGSILQESSYAPQISEALWKR